MFFSLLSFLTGFVLILLLPILFLRKRTDKNINPYLFILFGIVGIQRFLDGLIFFKVIELDFNPFDNKGWLIFLITNVHYLFFKNLLSKRTTYLYDFTIFSIAFLIFAFLEIFEISRPKYFIVFNIYSTVFVFLMARIIFREVFNKKNQKELEHFKSIKNWTLIMFGLTLSKYIFANFFIYIHLNDPINQIKMEYYSLTNFVWIFIIIYIFRNPVILYGNQFLLKKINKSNVGDIKFWENNKTLSTLKSDLELERRIKPDLERILFEIKKFEDNLSQNFKHVPSLKELSLELQFPESHLKYIFKYYCYFSFGEYQNALKIKYAIRLIKSGYLERKTIDSLWTECLFNSRMTFYNNFKNITGYSVSAYRINMIEASQA
jgi:AraC-like DNA-binding protein